MSGGASADRTKNTIRSGKLAGKSLTAAIWILTWPILVQQTMGACVGLFDKIIAGHLPQEIVVSALDGLGIGSYVGWFIGIAMTGLGIGGQAIIARAMGAGRTDEADRTLGQAMLLSMGWGAIVGIVLWFGAPWLARLCGLTPDAAMYCVQYVRCVAVSMPMAGIMFVGSLCLHGAGETFLPSVIAIGVNFVNIFLSWMLSGADLPIGSSVLENPFPFDLHVIGIAAGTALSYAFGAAATIMVLRRGVKDLRLRRVDMSLDRPMIRRIIRVGVPNFFEGISMWTVNLLVLVVIGMLAVEGARKGEGLQGAHIIAVQWEAFSFLPGFAIGTAAGTLAGQYLGAGNRALASRAILVCTGIGIVLMQVIGLAFIFAGKALTQIVSSQPVHVDVVPKLLLIAGLTQVFFAATMVVRQGLRGVGDTKWTFIITTASSYLVRLPAAWFLGVKMGMGLEGVWIALCGELVVRALLFGARFFHGGWKRLEI